MERLEIFKKSERENGKASIFHQTCRSSLFPSNISNFEFHASLHTQQLRALFSSSRWYYRVESTREKHKSHLSPDIKWIYQNFFYADDMSQTIGGARPHKLFPSKLLEHNKENGCGGVDRLWSGICIVCIPTLFCLFSLCFQDGEKVKCE